MHPPLFIAGTDTGVGKTRVATVLAHALHGAGIDVRVRKPAESGCAERDGVLFPADADALRRAAGAREPLEVVCPVRLRAAVSPERAAELEGRVLSLDMLADACRAPADAQLLVEGAGGVLSPIATGALNLDLAVRLGARVVLVAADRLGTLNHSLLALEAIERRGLALAGIVMSRAMPEVDADMDNAADLARWSGHEVHRLPYSPPEGDAPWERDLPHLAALARTLHVPA